MLQFHVAGRTKVIDAVAVERLLETEGLDAWAAIIGRQLDSFLNLAPHGDWVRWQAALAQSGKR